MENQNNSQTNTKKILVVEDEDSLRLALSKMLESAGYAVLQANNGAEGLDTSFKHHPSLILLDIAMPIMDGMTMLDKIRQDEWGKQVKVILLTNFDADDEKICKVVEDQPSYYLVKNNNTLDQILDKVRDLVSTEEGEMG